MTIKPEYYYTRFDQIRVIPEYEFGLAQDFISELLSLPPSHKFSLLQLFEKIEEDAFDKGINIPNLNYESLLNEKRIWEESLGVEVKKKVVKSNTTDDFNKVLFQFFSKYESFFQKTKGYFVFRLTNTSDSPTKVLVLYDGNFNKHPEIGIFDATDDHLEVKRFELQSFVDSKQKKAEILNENYLCVILTASNLGNNELILPKISELLDGFSNSSYVPLKKIPPIVSGDYEIKDSSEGIEVLKNYSDKVFNNREISFEEELIIKKVFDGNEMILDYKVLKGGNSGSKIIEIQPFRGNHPEVGRFVVKFDKINSERKIKKEKYLFREYITDLRVPNYTAEYEQTLSYEAIRYNYASSDSIKDSFPFSKLINDYIKGKFTYTFSLKDVINELFESDPYKKWNAKYPVTESVKNLYAGYLKSEGKIFKNVALIKGIEESEIENDELIKNYKIIKEYSLKTYKKICHGDLHSENFFKDEKGVYLIDFGWTGKHHSVVDHAILECSIKFKHLPFYIPVIDLVEYDKALFSIKSFSNGFDLSFIKRPIAFDLFNLVTQIRMKAIDHMADKSSALEYLISLFVINFRQIQYSDLNQTYALASAEMLSGEIIKLISN